MSWTIEALNSTVQREIEALPADIRARLVRYSLLIENAGFAALPTSASRSLGGAIWELRLQGRDGMGRALYVTIEERRVVIVRAFVKKTQKTPVHELKLARDRVRTIE